MSPFGQVFNQTLRDPNISTKVYRPETFSPSQRLPKMNHHGLSQPRVAQIQVYQIWIILYYSANAINYELSLFS